FDMLEIDKFNEKLKKFFVDIVFILKKLVEMKFKPVLSLQIRAVLITGSTGNEFLNLVSQLNCILEFGMQSNNKKELITINRPSNLTYIKKLIKRLNKMGFKYVVSFIYGLPYQNIKSIKKYYVFVNITMLKILNLID